MDVQDELFSRMKHGRKECIRLNGLVRKMSTLRAMLQYHKDQARRDVDAYVNKMLEALKQFKAESHWELDDRYQKKVAKMEHTKCEMEADIEVLTELCEDADQLLNSDMEAVASRAKISTLIEGFGTLCSKHLDVNVDRCLTLSFKPAYSCEEIQSSMFGCVVGDDSVPGSESKPSKRKDYAHAETQTDDSLTTGAMCSVPCAQTLTANQSCCGGQTVSQYFADTLGILSPPCSCHDVRPGGLNLRKKTSPPPPGFAALNQPGSLVSEPPSSVNLYLSSNVPMLMQQSSTAFQPYHGVLPDQRVCTCVSCMCQVSSQPLPDIRAKKSLHCSSYMADIDNARDRLKRKPPGLENHHLNDDVIPPEATGVGVTDVNVDNNSLDRKKIEPIADEELSDCYAVDVRDIPLPMGPPRLECIKEIDEEKEEQEGIDDDDGMLNDEECVEKNENKTAAKNADSVKESVTGGCKDQDVPSKFDRASSRATQVITESDRTSELSGDGSDLFCSRVDEAGDKGSGDQMNEMSETLIKAAEGGTTRKNMKHKDEGKISADVTVKDVGPTLEDLNEKCKEQVLQVKTKYFQNLKGRVIGERLEDLKPLRLPMASTLVNVSESQSDTTGRFSDTDLKPLRRPMPITDKILTQAVLKKDGSDNCGDSNRLNDLDKASGDVNSNYLTVNLNCPVVPGKGDESTESIVKPEMRIAVCDDTNITADILRLCSDKGPTLREVVNNNYENTSTHKNLNVLKAQMNWCKGYLKKRLTECESPVTEDWDEELSLNKKQGRGEEVEGKSSSREPDCVEKLGSSESIKERNLSAQPDPAPLSGNLINYGSKGNASKTLPQKQIPVVIRERASVPTVTGQSKLDSVTTPTSALTSEWWGDELDTDTTVTKSSPFPIGTVINQKVEAVVKLAVSVSKPDMVSKSIKAENADAKKKPIVNESGRTMSSIVKGVVDQNLSRDQTVAGSRIGPLQQHWNKIGQSPGSNAVVKGKLLFTCLGDMHFPIGVCSNSQGKIIVADTGNHCLRMFTADGAPDMEFGKVQCTGMRRPSAVVVNDNDEIFVKDDVCIRVFSASGTFERNIAEDLFKKPFGLVIASNGRLIVLETAHQNPSLVHISQDGKCVCRFTYQPLVGQSGPNGISKCRFMGLAENSVVVSDLGASLIYITTLEGHLLKTLGCYGHGPMEFFEPSGITVDKFGNILIGDSKNNRIQMYRHDGTYMGILVVDAAIRRPSGIHLTADNSLLVVNFLQHQVLAFLLESC